MATPRQSDFPGEQLFKSVTFSVGGIIYDWYGKCQCGANVRAAGPWYSGIPPEYKKCIDCRFPAEPKGEPAEPKGEPAEPKGGPVVSKGGPVVPKGGPSRVNKRKK